MARERALCARSPKKQARGSSVRGITIFYFTDNMTTYWIAQSGSSPTPSLHLLIEDIRMLELELGCELQVVHVPGVVVIDQGTDGLSRGVWVSPLQALTDQVLLTSQVFAPLTFDSSLVQHYCYNHGLTSAWRYQPWDRVWDARQCFHRLTVWFPPPEIARQAITFMLESWVESPLTTSALFFVPRTVPAFWFGLSRHLVELETLAPRSFPLHNPPLLPIPIVVLYLPPHTRRLPTKDRLGKAPPPPEARWHREQADKMRGLPPRSIE